MQWIQQLQSHLKNFGIHDTVGRGFVRAVRGITPGAFHRRDTPSLSRLAKGAAVVSRSGEDLASQLKFADAQTLKRLRAEHDELRTEVQGRLQSTRLTYPHNFTLERDSSLLLYSLIRTFRPETLLETGVADGYSTFFILRALRMNGTGKLYSVDLSHNVGSLLSKEERDDWNLRVIGPRPTKKSFSRIVANLPARDLFLHDSDHTYQWQSFELKCALSRISRSGIVLCDDADASFAFLDFASAQNLPAYFLVEPRKVLGLTFSSSTVPQPPSPRESLPGSTA